MKTMGNGRTASVGALVSLFVLGSAAAVFAVDPPTNKRISNGREGWESTRWSDEQYSKLWFKGCDAPSVAGLPESVTVRYYKDKDFFPDPGYGSRKFTKCFESGSAISVGEWRNLPRQDGYYVRIVDINSTAYETIDVARYSVDTTAAE